MHRRRFFRVIVGAALATAVNLRMAPAITVVDDPSSFSYIISNVMRNNMDKIAAQIVANNPILEKLAQNGDIVPKKYVNEDVYVWRQS